MSVKDREDKEPLEEAWEEDPKEPRLLELDMERVEAERSLSWDSNVVTLRIEAFSWRSKYCFSS